MQQFTVNLAFMELFDNLRNSMTDEGKRIGQDIMKPYFDRERLGEKLGRLHEGLPMHGQEGSPPMSMLDPKTNQWEVKTQEAFVPRPSLDGTNGTILLQPESFESEAVYIHILRMVAMAIDVDFQVLVKTLADQNAGEHRGVPIKGMCRMWTKLAAADDHRHLSLEQKMAGMTRRSGPNIDINRCAVTFDNIEAFKVHRGRGDGLKGIETGGGGVGVWGGYITESSNLYFARTHSLCYTRTLSNWQGHPLTASHEQKICLVLVKRKQSSSCTTGRS
jgi:hypothetical protein